jgi:UDP-N-acetylmuramoylalanine--D-glutamate ligase
MREAVTLAKKMLNRGGTVILSPAATSFDKYPNFEARGNDFIKTVKETVKENI